ncbi:MAG: 2-oxoglutarate dehydrogenase complex dihydrolipoyllysine-residue succinyltransferase [Phycisphaerales bacterium]
MPVELKVPEVGESITEVAIGRWLKTKGQTVRKDDPIVEIETDKVTLELPAPADGTIGELLKKQGDAAVVGETIAYMESGDVPAEDTSKPAASKSSQSSEAPAKADNKKSANGSDAARVMPAAQRLIDENKLDASAIPPSGPGGRILKEDVKAFLDGGAQAGKQKPAAAQSPAQAPASSSGERQEQVIPMTPMRKSIAAHLVKAQQTAALLTTFNEIDMTAVMDLRNQYKDSFQKKYDIKLGFMSFFTKAVIDALKQFPAVNAEVRGTDIVYKDYYDIGIAVGTGKGLVVPVLRNAERMSFAEVEKAIAGFGQKIKENKLALEDLQGGTFTITNGGIFGSLLSTPIVNPPQSAVLGMHAIQRRPVAIGEGATERVEIRPMMYVALTYDHRLVDGREAVSFLVRIKQTLEDPARMLMEV